jgi:hypothetical protein
MSDPTVAVAGTTAARAAKARLEPGAMITARAVSAAVRLAVRVVAAGLPARVALAVNGPAFAVMNRANALKHPHPCPSWS